MRAPFNFVPLPEQTVFYPDWANKISFDAPFKDAQCGKIHLKITAKTPIFVRQGHKTDSESPNTFVNRDGNYFIPATTIKGAVRSILEIISFGKFRLQQAKGEHLDDLLPNYDANRMDLAECIFGKITRNNLEGGVKGRVQFSHAELKSELHELKDIPVYCGQPHASFYPIYVKQEGENGKISEEGYFTLDDKAEDGAYLKGWKRYPVRSQIMNPLPDIPEGQEEHAQHFKPLAADSVFECDMRYFNLKRVELGALLYAMNLFEGAIYSLGFGKPYGFGQVKIELSGNDEIETLKQEFISLMCEKITNYEDSEQLHELKLMMTEQPDKEPLLTYMSFEEYQEFEDTYLPYYSEIHVAEITEKDNEQEDSAKEPQQMGTTTATTADKGILASVISVKKDILNKNSIIVEFTIEEGKKAGKKAKTTIQLDVNTKFIRWDEVKQIKVEFNKEKNKYVYLSKL